MMSSRLSPNAWRVIESIPEFGPSGLYVFRVNLPVTTQLERQCYDVLTESELERVARFKNEQARRLTLVGRGVLRCLLSSFLGLSPKSIPLRVGPAGKPEVDGISCNVAHSGDIVLLALAPSGLIGVDVEQINPATPVLEIADRYFATTEIAAIRGASNESEQQAEFFHHWARKESLIKADGRGLSIPLSSFAADDVTSIPDSTGILRTYRVHTLPMGPEYSAAVATNDLSAAPSLFLYPEK